jgi:hypothetical protein
MRLQILVKCPNTKFTENPFNGSWAVTYRQTDMDGLIEWPWEWEKFQYNSSNCTKMYIQQFWSCNMQMDRHSKHNRHMFASWSFHLNKFLKNQSYAVSPNTVQLWRNKQLSRRADPAWILIVYCKSILKIHLFPYNSALHRHNSYAILPQLRLPLTLKLLVASICFHPQTAGL